MLYLYPIHPLHPLSANLPRPTQQIPILTHVFFMVLSNPHSPISAALMCTGGGHLLECGQPTNSHILTGKKKWPSLPQQPSTINSSLARGGTHELQTAGALTSLIRWRPYKSNHSHCSFLRTGTLSGSEDDFPLPRSSSPYVLPSPSSVMSPEPFMAVGLS